MNDVFCLTADFRLSSLRSCKLMYGAFVVPIAFFGQCICCIDGNFGLPGLQVN